MYSQRIEFSYRLNQYLIFYTYPVIVTWDVSPFAHLSSPKLECSTLTSSGKPSMNPSNFKNTLCSKSLRNECKNYDSSILTKNYRNLYLQLNNKNLLTLPKSLSLYYYQTSKNTYFWARSFSFCKYEAETQAIKR